MIVPMTAAHLPQIAALERACFSDPWSEASLCAELNNPLSRWLVAEEGGAVIGYIGAQSVPPEADMMNLAVAPDWRGRGVGKALVRALCTLLRGAGITSLSLEVRVSNLPARGLYCCFGFAEVGRRKRYYEKPVEDALILRKELQDDSALD